METNCQQCIHKNYSLFGSCSLQEQNRLKEWKSMRTLPKGSILYKEGESPTHIFCLYNGLVKLVKNAGQEDEHIIQIMKGSDIPGLKAFLAGDLHAETAILLQTSTYCRIPVESIDHLLRSSKAFNRESLVYLAGIASQYEQQISSLMTKPVKSRVAEALLLLHRSYMDEASNPDGHILLSRKDLASYCGTVKETLLRTLKQFREAGLIETQGSSIRLLDVAGLVRVSGGR
jgi:CRP/FNR family transcriptional regulator, polysaccharide utilization system transcription regulator